MATVQHALGTFRRECNLFQIDSDHVHKLSNLHHKLVRGRTRLQLIATPRPNICQSIYASKRKYTKPAAAAYETHSTVAPDAPAPADSLRSRALSISDLAAQLEHKDHKQVVILF